MNTDKTIAGDLAALGENSRRDIPALDDVLRQDVYRDDRPGAEARRNALADERKRELVLMPLTLSHVFAHRVGRIAAGGMALVVATSVLAMLADPLLLRFARWMVPGLNLGMLVTIAALAIVSSYVVASWIAEAWFARRMRAAIKTGDDAYKDIDHLARGPIEIAQAAVHRVDAWSLGLFLAGATSVTIVFGYLFSIVGMQHTISNAWQLDAASGMLESNLGILAVVGIAVVVKAAVIARSLDRDGSLGARVTKLLSGWPALVVAGVVGIATAYNGLHVMLTWRHSWPSEEARILIAIGASFTVFVPSTWALLYWRRREHARIG